ncbi:MAG: hypothetical protein M1834_009031 [Cirrosporium novae-zelandiae]|nr:MAG: hypothetical protein M1834_009031 [Cirrosporium novae-zelandiae]
MPREAEPSANERSFVLAALRENVRIDGRQFDAFRDLELNFGDNGVADVKLGKTRVIARISAEVTQPLSDRKFDGIFTITTELSPIAFPAFETGRQTDQEVILSRILEKAIRRSNALNTESLCIIAGQKCWNVRADVHVIDYDGGLVDASCVAVIAALEHFRRPDVSVDGEEVTIHPPAERVPVPLSMMHHPFCVTFSFFDDGNIMVMDGTLQEEQMREGEIIITMNKFGEVCQLIKLGGIPVDALAILNCTRIGLVKVQELTKLVMKRLDEDRKSKDVDGLIAELTAENDR